MAKQYEFIKAEQGSPEWLELRKHGIGASDIPVILGMSKYKTPYELWAEKTGKVEPEPAGEAAERGHILEDAVATFYEKRTSAKTRRSNGICRLKEHPWAFCSLDRTIEGEEGLVEIKTSTSRAWELDPVPDFVQAQVQYQMLVTGAPWVDVAALLGSLNFRIERVYANQMEQAVIFNAAQKFWEAVETDTPPAILGRDSDVFAKVVPQQRGDILQATPEIEMVAQAYADATYEEDLSTEHLRNLAIEMKQAIGDAEGIRGNGWSATWKQNKDRVSVDWKAVSMALGVTDALIQQHTTTEPGARVFRFKKQEN
jgi:putative phage-type endonuclease